MKIGKVFIDGIWNLEVKDYTYEIIGGIKALY